MSVIDFFKRLPVAVAQQMDSVPRAAVPVSVTPEELIENGNWTFAPEEATNQRITYSDESVNAAVAIYVARQVRRIADDVEAMRKHVTRLRLVKSDDDGASHE